MPYEVIFSLREGALLPVEPAPYEDEREFQEMLATHPKLLASLLPSSSGSGADWLLVRREMGVPADPGGSPRWSLDHLFIDQEAVPTLVEVKRATDTRIRREVVGQMLDYAANGLAYWPPQGLRDEAERTHDGPEGLAARLAALLGRAELDEAGADQYFREVASNLASGRVRLVFVADEVPMALQKVVEFLNGQLRMAEVFAVEVLRYHHDGGYVIVPRLVGATAAADAAKGTNAPPLSLDEIFASASADARRLREVITEWAERNGLELSSSGRMMRVGKGSRQIALLDTRQYSGASGHLILALKQLYQAGKLVEADEALERLRGLFGAGLTSSQTNLPAGPLLERWSEAVPVLDALATAIAAIGS